MRTLSTKITLNYKVIVKRIQGLNCPISSLLTVSRVDPFTSLGFDWALFRTITVDQRGGKTESERFTGLVAMTIWTGKVDQRQRLWCWTRPMSNPRLVRGQQNMAQVYYVVSNTTMTRGILYKVNVLFCFIFYKSAQMHTLHSVTLVSNLTQISVISDKFVQGIHCTKSGI